MTIGERIAKCRKEKNLSQEYIAELLDVSRQAVSKWENDQTEPDTSNLIQLAKIFCVSVEYLANGEEMSPKVVYVEKIIPIYKIIGAILISLGGLSLILGAVMSYMLGIGIFTVAFGILFILLKKDGLILSGIILALGFVLFLIQGIFFGIDTPILCLIAAISVGLPILTYAIIGLVRKIKTDGTIKKLKNNPMLIKRIIIVTVIAAMVITAIAIPASIAIKKRRNAFEKTKFFSSEKLSEFMVEGLPAPKDIDCINLNSATILFNTDTYEFNEYLESIYNYLIRKGFKHLGTRGEVIYADGESKAYEFIPHDKNYHYGAYKHSGFSSNEAPDDYYFIYSNNIMNEKNGEIECYVIHIKAVETSEAIIDGKKFVYDTIMSVYGESVSEGYKYPTYNIEYTKSYYSGKYNLAEMILPNQPTLSLPGKEITVRIEPQNEDIELWIDGGKKIQRTAVTDEYWEYSFTMPKQDIKLWISPKEEALWNSYTISYEENGYSLIDGYAPTSAKAGKIVVIRTHPLMDVDLILYANGVKADNTHSDSDYWEYRFIMPEDNVVITAEFVGDSPASTNYFLRNQVGYEWLNEITAKDIAEIKIIREAIGVALGNLKSISISTDKTVIARIFEEYYWLDSAPISKIDGQIDGGSGVTIKFILKDGTENKLYINNGNCRDTNDNYFKLLYTPSFKESDNATKAYGFITYIDTGKVYDKDNNLACEIPIDELEFIEFDGCVDDEVTGYYYTVETEFGTLWFDYSNDIFYLRFDEGENILKKFYKIVGKNLDELIDECKFFAISYEGYGYSLIDGYAPTSANAGDTVVIRTHPLMDVDLILYANGVKADKTHSDSDYWEYTFVMPEENVVITRDIVGGM